jgi:hypothetical protein
MPEAASVVHGPLKKLRKAVADHHRGARFWDDDRRRPRPTGKPVVLKCIEKGLLINAVQEKTLAFLPPSHRQSAPK